MIHQLLSGMPILIVCYNYNNSYNDGLFLEGVGRAGSGSGAGGLILREGMGRQSWISLAGSGVSRAGFLARS